MTDFKGTPRNPRPLPRPRIQIGEARKHFTKRKLIGFILITWFLVGNMFILSAIISFINTHDFRSPFQIPWTVKKIKSKPAAIVNPIPQAEAKEKEVTPTPSEQLVDVLVAKIYRLESSGGVNDGCRNRGLYNGYGYAQNDSTWQCFSSPDEVEGKVRSWVKGKLDHGYSVPQLLCYYNEGIVKDNCGYYQRFLAL